jgi:hypothetical protein
MDPKSETFFQEQLRLANQAAAVVDTVSAPPPRARKPDTRSTTADGHVARAIRPRSEPSDSELTGKRMAFLKALQRFVDSDEIRIETSLIKANCVSTVLEMKNHHYIEQKLIIEQTIPHVPEMETRTHVYACHPTNGRLRDFCMRYNVEKLFHQIGEKNGHKPVKRWSDAEVVAVAQDYFDQPARLLTTLFDNTIFSEPISIGKLPSQHSPGGEPKMVAQSISAVLGDIALMAPAEKVSLANADALFNRHYHPDDLLLHNQWRNFGETLRQLPVSPLSGRLIAAAERSGLIKAAQALYGEPAKRGLDI